MEKSVVLSIILFIVMAIALVCIKAYDNSQAYADSVLKENVHLSTLEFNGEKHEYVVFVNGYKGSVSHWAGCKYCKCIK